MKSDKSGLGSKDDLDRAGLEDRDNAFLDTDTGVLSRLPSHMLLDMVHEPRREEMLQNVPDYSNFLQ